MTLISQETKSATPSQRSHSSSIRSMELPQNKSPGLVSQNGQATPPDAQPKPTEKASVKDRLTRMFSQRQSPSATPIDSAVGHGSSHQPPKKQVAQQAPPQQLPVPFEASQSPQPAQQSPVPPPSRSQSISQHPILPPAAKDGLVLAATSSNGSVPLASGTTSPATKSHVPSRKGSATDKAVEKFAAAVAAPAAPVKVTKAATSYAQIQRFVVDPSLVGGHEHHLKSSRRQEKLVDMFRGLLGKKQEHPDGDLSLVSSWVDNLKQEKVELTDKKALEKKLGSVVTAAPSTLIEKYGKCQEIVGRGAFGIVRISHKKLGDGSGEKLYAVKEFRRRPEENEKKYSKRLTAEFCISSSLHHHNIIHTLDLLKDAKGDYCEVMEFCAGGDLYTLVLAAGRLEVQEADCFFKQLMRGVGYMHEMGVAHRDLKPENLLLTTHGGLKITDFGNGECFRMAWESDAHMVSGLCGSAPYIAPEEYVSKEFDARAVDVWACGVIYMAMRTGRHLWRVAKKDDDEFYERYLDGRRDEEGYGPIESLHRARCRNVIYSILDPNPTRRITASQVLKSEWGREIKLCTAGEEGL